MMWCRVPMAGMGGSLPLGSIHSSVQSGQLFARRPFQVPAGQVHPAGSSRCVASALTLPLAYKTFGLFGWREPFRTAYPLLPWE